MKYFFITLIIIFFYKIAYSNNLFETKFYNVEFISNNIDNDKINKIQEIKKASLLNIFKETLENDDYNKVVSNVSIDLINSFIKNIIIDDERIVNDKYLSNIKINFDKKKIIKFYRQKKIPYVEYLPNKILLIIYEENPLNYDLFSENNDFYNYFKNKLASNSIFKIPNLDINDRFILNKNHIVNKDTEKIKNFAKKYDLNDFVVVEVTTKNKNFSYDLTLYSNDQIKEKEFKFEENKLNKFFAYIENETINFWKKLNHIQNKSLNHLNCRVNYYNLQELKEIRNKLNNSSIIKTIDIKSLSYKNIEYDIYYYGNLKILLKIFKMNDLKISEIKKLCQITLI